MEFWVIAHKDEIEAGYFYNIETGREADILSEQCLLPAKSLAEQLINDELNTDFKPVAIKLEFLDSNGDFLWSMGHNK